MPISWVCYPEIKPVLHLCVLPIQFRFPPLRKKDVLFLGPCALTFPYVEEFNHNFLVTREDQSVYVVFSKFFWNRKWSRMKWQYMGLQLPLMCTYLNHENGKPSFPETRVLHVKHAYLVLWFLEGWFYVLVLLSLHASGDGEGGLLPTAPSWLLVVKCWCDCLQLLNATDKGQPEAPVFPPCLPGRAHSHTDMVLPLTYSSICRASFSSYS